MDDRWTDLLANLRELFAADTSEDVIASYLSNEGYDGGQIGEIVARLRADRSGLPGAERPGIPAFMTFRVMGPHERGRFAPDAWGHLLSLNGAGILNGAELEHVIDRAMAQFDGRIALDDLRSLLEGVGFEESGPADHVTLH